jgi:kynureninase
MGYDPPHMLTSRRDFMRSSAACAVVPSPAPRVLDGLERRLAAFGSPAPAASAADESYWAEIRKVFPVPAGYVNLENGYCSAQPAELAGCPADEIVITRNTTESPGTVIHGVDLAPGDEAVMCTRDYGSMLEQFRQRSRRPGLKCVEVDVPLHPKSDEEIVETYARAFTPRTKLLLVSHTINITGQVLPVRKIADMAHARGVAEIVDAAHSFAHVVFKATVRAANPTAGPSVCDERKRMGLVHHLEAGS